MSILKIERRRHPRYAYSTKLEFLSNPLTPNTTHSGLSVNISSSGMCLYTFFKPLDEGEDIAFKDDLPVSYQKAMVKWVQQYAEDFYGVGVMFV
jgi:PilZ domain